MLMCCEWLAADDSDDVTTARSVSSHHIKASYAEVWERLSNEHKNGEERFACYTLFHEYNVQSKNMARIRFGVELVRCGVSSWML